MKQNIDSLWIKVKRQISNVDVQYESTFQTDSTIVDGIKLHKLNLPSFSGDIQDWLGFRDLLFQVFVTIAENEKLSY